MNTFLICLFGIGNRGNAEDIGAKKRARHGSVCDWSRLCLRPRIAIGEAADLSLVTSRQLHHGVLICLRRVGKLDVDESCFFVRVCLGGVGIVDRFGVRFVFCQPFLG